MPLQKPYPPTEIEELCRLYKASGVKASASGHIDEAERFKEGA